MVADSALPVWSIKPNWRDGILERLSWLTDVLGSTYGTEQRRALRLSPRRSFEVNFVPIDRERAFFDLWLHRLGSNEFMVPLWHDTALLSGAVAVGATSIPFDTSYREFVAGGLAIIVGADPFTYDKVEVTAVAADHLTVAAGGVTQVWPSGTIIHPLRRARLEEESAAAAITSRFGQATLRFELNQANDIPDEGAWGALYTGVPIILTEPNRRDQLELTFKRNRLLEDNEIGLRELVDEAGRSFTLQTHQLLLSGRQEQWAFRQMLYRLRGQQAPVWLPTFNDDIELSSDALAADALIDIKKIGYAYTGGYNIGGRQHILLDGSIGREIIGLGAEPSAAEEQLVLDAALGVDLPSGTYGSFMDICRLGQDEIEIKHLTDSDGVAEAALSFRSFRDERTTPDPIDFPIPLSFERTNSCGSLIGLSWTLPCISRYEDPNSCNCGALTEQFYSLPGDPGTTYTLTFRVRGVVELTAYSGGTALAPSYLYKDATAHDPTVSNVYKLEVSDPPAIYYFNNGVFDTAGPTAVDYEFTFDAVGGATITLRAETNDSKELNNDENVVVADDDPARPIVVAQPYDGQFLQIDLES